MTTPTVTPIVRYVLLKERNMLLTVKQEANRELYIMPGPERLRKVRRSMARIKVVLFERVSKLTLVPVINNANCFRRLH